TVEVPPAQHSSHSSAIGLRATGKCDYRPAADLGIAATIRRITSRGSIPMADAFICDAVRTPIGRYAGALSSVRTDDLAALPIAALLKRNASLEAAALDEVVFGCANQAGEDNRNVARMASLLAGLPVDVPAITVNRLC